METCSKRGNKLLAGLEYLGLHCQADQSKAPFGVDPTFVPTSSLFRDPKGEDRSKANGTRTNEKMTTTGVPFGFTFDQGAAGAADYPVFFGTTSIPITTPCGALKINFLSKNAKRSEIIFCEVTAFQGYAS